jgi:hypothetical protein
MSIGVFLTGQNVACFHYLSMIEKSSFLIIFADSAVQGVGRTTGMQVTLRPRRTIAKLAA